MKKLRMLSLCSGIGGVDLAAEWTGEIEIVGQVEINTFCQSVLSKHWPSVLRLSDIKDVRGDEFGAIDIVAGGIPCQPFSSAGKRRGVEDDRHLWPYAFAIVQQARPRWVLIENVRNFVPLALDLLLADLASAGYEAGAVVLPACAVGAPHIRERCFVVAYHPGKRSGTWGAEPEGQQRTTDAHGSGSSDVAHADRNRWGQREDQPQREQTRKETPNAGVHGTQGTLADAQYKGCERGVFDTIQSGAWSEPQSRMGRMLHGISARLDRARWPAPPGPQFEWEPRRVVGSVSGRRERIEALGNAVVPYQVYPFFAGIVEWERMAGGQEG